MSVTEVPTVAESNDSDLNSWARNYAEMVNTASSHEFTKVIGSFRIAASEAGFDIDTLHAEAEKLGLLEAKKGVTQVPRSLFQRFRDGVEELKLLWNSDKPL